MPTPTFSSLFVVSWFDRAVGCNWRFYNLCGSRLKAEDDFHTGCRNVSYNQQQSFPYWKSKICSSSRLEFFSKIKENFVEEPFLDEVKNYDVKRNFFKFRTSNLSLFIETGRYWRPILPREKSICKFCKNDEIENELHLLFKSSLYADLRKIFFQKVARILDFNPDDQSNALNMMFTSTNRISKIHIANYIPKCLSRRKDIIAMEIWSMLYNIIQQIFTIIIQYYTLNIFFISLFYCFCCC